MASQTIQAVYLEAVEETGKQIPESAKTRHPGEICLDDSDAQKKLLVHSGNHRREKSHIKQKAHTLRIL